MKTTLLASRSKQLSTLVLLLGVGVGAWAGAADMPATQHSGDVAYVTGGVGLAQSDAFKQQMSQYPLALEIVQHQGNKDLYTAGANVRIADASGQVVLQTVAEGPFVLADLPAGRYTVDVTLNGQLKHQPVAVNDNASVRKVFVFQAG